MQGPKAELKVEVWGVQNHAGGRLEVREPGLSLGVCVIEGSEWKLPSIWGSGVWKR